MTRHLLAGILLSACATAPAPAPAPRGHEAAVADVFTCFQDRAACDATVFTSEAARGWPAVAKKLGANIIRNGRLVAHVPAEATDRWKKRWLEAVEKLAAAGYDAKAARELGLGRSWARIGPRVMLALTALDGQRQRPGSGVESAYLVLVLWRADGVEATWRVAYFEDSTLRITTFLQKNRRH